jgi:1,4-alpha-glucan branching enzyme
MHHPLGFQDLEILPGHIIRSVRLYCRSARSSVWVAGNFSGEHFIHVPLRREKEGLWSIRLMLTPGRYRYKFVVRERNK